MNNDDQEKTPPQATIEMLRKIKALAEHGVDGEKKVAETKLRMLLAKHGLTIDDLMANESRTHYFKVRSSDVFLLFQIVFMVTNQNEITYYHGKYPSCYGFSLTTVQYADVSEAFAYYKKILSKARRKALETFRDAFIFKFGLNSGIQSNGETPEMTKEEISSLLSTMQNIEGEKWLKPLAKLEFESSEDQSTQIEKEEII